MKKMQRLMVILSASLSTLILIGCQSKELNRQKAKSIIEATEEFSKPHQALITLSPEEINRGVALKLWKTGVNPYMGFRWVDFTPSARSTFQVLRKVWRPGLCMSRARYLFVQKSSK